MAVLGKHSHPKREMCYYLICVREDALPLLLL
jgi:hypothetical protein